MRLVLASASPSRRAILTQAGCTPVVDPADVDEDAILESTSDFSPEKRVCALASAKAHAVADRHPGDLVVGCDSMLLSRGTLIGKPYTVEETIRRWKAQRDTTARLITGHCFLGPQGQEFVRAATTTVFFGSPTDTDIEAYAATEEPLLCAGAFTLEAIGGWFIDRIEGDPSNVIGLSLPLLRQALYRFDLHVSDVLSHGVSPAL